MKKTAKNPLIRKEVVKKLAKSQMNKVFGGTADTIELPKPPPTGAQGPLRPYN